MSRPVGIVDRILAALEEIGASTSAELAEHLGLEHRQIVGNLPSLTKPRKTMPRRVRVASYTRNHKGDLVRIYELGSKPHAQKPEPMTHSERHRKSVLSKVQRFQMSSVFRMGMGKVAAGRCGSKRQKEALERLAANDDQQEAA